MERIRAIHRIEIESDTFFDFSPADKRVLERVVDTGQPVLLTCKNDHVYPHGHKGVRLRKTPWVLSELRAAGNQIRAKATY